MRVISAVIGVAEGHAVNVAQVCRDGGVSRKTFYKWLARYRGEGLDGVAERSRRPHRSPNQIATVVEEEVVRLRKLLQDDGVDHGATTIQWHLGNLFRGDPAWPQRVPSVATIHRILVRRGHVVPEPHKRPKTSWQRFEASAPNECWQIDAMDWVIASGPVKVFNVIDDHSRVAVRSRAVMAATGQEAWTTFCQAAERWRMPAGMLSDNGLCFSGKLKGFEVLFEANLRDAGVRPITGRPYHPQTTGKVERFQQTVKKRLRRHRHLCGDLAELQAELNEFIDYYNHQRPHQGIGRVTPISRWNATAASGPSPEPLPHPQRLRRVETTVGTSGVVRVEPFRIHIGVKWAHQRATVLIDGRHANVFINDTLVRHLRLDPDRSYQPSGRPRRPRKP